MQIMSFAGGLACGYLADRRGSSRSVLATWWALGGLSVLALVFLDGHVVNIVCTAAAGFFVIGAQYVLNNFTARSFDTNVRATAVGMMLSVGRFGAILGPFVVGTLQQVSAGPMPMFVLIGCASIVAAIAIASLAARPAPTREAAGLHVHG